MAAMCGIYAITHIASGKRYIGQSVRVGERIRAHRGYLRAGTHENPKLARSVAKHGIDAFRFELLVIATPETLNFYEQLLIDGFDTVRSGYNVAPIAESTHGTKRTTEQRARMSEVQRVSMVRPEVIAAVSRGTKAAMRRPEVRANHLVGMASPRGRENFINAISSDEYRARQLAVRATDAFRSRLSASLTRAWQKPERRQKQVAAINAKYADPHYKKKFDAAMRTETRRALIAKQASARWADPEYKARVGAKISEAYARKKAGICR